MTSVSSGSVISAGGSPDDLKPRSPNKFNIAIAATTFRFSPPIASEQVATPKVAKPIQNQKDVQANSLPKTKTEEEKKESSIPNPPLSWMLSPYDRYRIEQAWQNQLLRLPKKKDESHGGPVNASGTADPDKNATNGASEAFKIIPLEKLDTIFEFQN